MNVQMWIITSMFHACVNYKKTQTYTRKVLMHDWEWAIYRKFLSCKLCNILYSFATFYTLLEHSIQFATFYTVLQHSIQFCNILYSFATFYTALQQSIHFYNILYSFATFYTVLQPSIQTCNILYSFAAFYTVLQPSIQFCNILYSAATFYIVLQHSIQCWNLLYSFATFYIVLQHSIHFCNIRQKGYWVRTCKASYNDWLCKLYQLLHIIVPLIVHTYFINSTGSRMWETSYGCQVHSWYQGGRL